MKIAIPTVNKKLCLHFGHCEKFAFVEINEETKEILGTEYIEPPMHEPGVLPPWVAEQGASVVIVGGMGMRAKAIFENNGLKVIVGAEPAEPEKIVKAYFDETLKTGINACDH